MPDGFSSRTKFVVEHSNFFNPEQLYRFINLPGFDADWKELGLDDDDQCLLQIQIMLSPLNSPSVQGVEQFRLIPFCPPPKQDGKRVRTEVLYAVFPDFSVAIMAAASPYGEMEDILPHEKERLETILSESEDALKRGE